MVSAEGEATITLTRQRVKPADSLAEHMPCNLFFAGSWMGCHLDQGRLRQFSGWNQCVLFHQALEPQTTSGGSGGSPPTCFDSLCATFFVMPCVWTARSEVPLAAPKLKSKQQSEQKRSKCSKHALVGAVAAVCTAGWQLSFGRGCEALQTSISQLLFL